LVDWNGKGFDGYSTPAAAENGVATFAYEFMLNMNGLQGNLDDQ
jgi:hypothetical protein